MSKWYKYKVLLLENADTEEKTFLDKAMTYNEANLPIVQKEAYNGEYTIEDDGQPEPESQQTPEQRIAELESMLNALLGVSE